MWTISLPLRVPVTKNKHFSLNLNGYRNAHYQTLDRAKKNFDKIARVLIKDVPKMGSCSLEYVLYPANRQLCDTNNICTIVDKFFSDTLVAHGVIEDDNYQIVIDSRFRIGHIDRGNPRVDVIIRNTEVLTRVPAETLEPEKDAPMKIVTVSKSVVTLSREDLEKALRAYLAPHLSFAEDATLSVEGLHEEAAEFQVILETDEGAAPTDKPAATRKTRTVVEKPASPVKVVEAVPEPEPEVEAAPEPVAEEPVATPAPKPVKEDTIPAAKSLFGSYKRPNNAN